MSRPRTRPLRTPEQVAEDAAVGRIKTFWRNELPTGWVRQRKLRSDVGKRHAPQFFNECISEIDLDRDTIDVPILREPVITVAELTDLAASAFDASLAGNVKKAEEIVFGCAEQAALRLKRIIEKECPFEDKTGRRIQWEAIKALLNRLRILDGEAPVVKTGQINAPALIIDMRGSLVLNADRALPTAKIIKDEPKAVIDVKPQEPQA